MFRTSCSQHAIDVVGRKGWNQGREEIAARLRQCDGHYTPSEFEGRRTMHLFDGGSVEEDEIAEELIALYRVGRGAWPQL